eukprot:TRINITY_DN15030_c0_g1_i1.p1 TRINITY_DN15030_c0_g1~~TRINITY_DN15030_c0_g1_i1.p1  ORF type:complete len:309 (-),score=22.62 TRINITY_DN15030_c0_g1_i1:136-1062(-)
MTEMTSTTEKRKKAEAERFETGKLLTAGAIAGATSRTFTAPMDRVKVLLQVNKVGTISEAVPYIYNTDGLRGFWNGNMTNCLKVMPETAVRWIAFEKLKRAFGGPAGEDAKPLPHWQKFICGGSAAAIAQTFVYPLDTVKARMTTANKGEFEGLWKCVVSLGHQGLAGFYRGYIATIVGVIPHYGVEFVIFEHLKHNWSSHRVKSQHGDDPPVHLLLLFGGCSTATAALFSYPLAVVRTRLQTMGMKHNRKNQNYSGMIDCIRRIWQEEGARAFYAGLLPNLAKAVPSSAIQYCTFEVVRRYLGAESR